MRAQLTQSRSRHRQLWLLQLERPRRHRPWLQLRPRDRRRRRRLKHQLHPSLRDREHQQRCSQRHRLLIFRFCLRHRELQLRRRNRD
jgi:hypothetical protein